MPTKQNLGSQENVHLTGSLPSPEGPPPANHLNSVCFHTAQCSTSETRPTVSWDQIPLFIQAPVSLAIHPSSFPCLSTLADTPVTLDCPSYFSIAVIKICDQGNVWEKELDWAYGSRGLRVHDGRKNTKWWEQPRVHVSQAVPVFETSKSTSDILPPQGNASKQFVKGHQPGTESSNAWDLWETAHSTSCTDTPANRDHGDLCVCPSGLDKEGGMHHIAFSLFEFPKSNVIKLVLWYGLNIFAKGMSNYTALRDITCRKGTHGNRVTL